MESSENVGDGEKLYFVFGFSEGDFLKFFGSNDGR